MDRALLLDMDGTIFDTERVYHDAWIAGGLPEDLYFSMIGASRAHITALLRGHMPEEPEVYFARTEAAMQRLLEKGVPEKPGVAQLLDYAQQAGWRLAIATSSQTVHALDHLRRTGLTQRFAAVIGGDQIVHGKPAPDIYLKAAAALRCPPQACVVVEDSYNGVRAGHAAGMCTLMVPDMLPATAEMRGLARAVLPDLFAVRDFLRAQAEETGAAP